MATGILALMTSLGTGAAAAGTVASVTALTQLGTALKVGGAAFGLVSTLASSNYNAQVAANNVQIAESNAERSVQRAAVEAQEQDVQARGELGAMLASAGASGLNLGSGSALLRRKSAEELAAKDRGFIAFEGQSKAAQFKQQATDIRDEAALAKQQSFFSTIGQGINIGTSLVSGATKVNEITARGIRGRLN